MLPTFTKIFFCIFSDVIIVLCFFSDFIIYELREFNEEKLWRMMFMDDDDDLWMIQKLFYHGFSFIFTFRPSDKFVSW